MQSRSFAQMWRPIKLPSYSSYFHFSPPCLNSSWITGQFHWSLRVRETSVFELFLNSGSHFAVDGRAARCAFLALCPPPLFSSTFLIKFYLYFSLSTDAFALEASKQMYEVYPHLNLYSFNDVFFLNEWYGCLTWGNTDKSRN